MMLILAALLLQPSHPTPPVAEPLADIQLDARVTARRVVVDNRGRTSLTVRTSVNGREGENNIVDVDAPELPQGRRELGNVEVRVRAEARIPDPAATAQPEEPAEPQ